MSAFIVSDKHITAMLNSMAPRYPGDGARYYWNGETYYFNGHHNKVAQKLVDENYRSVNYRYTEEEAPHEYKRDFSVRTMTPVEIIKLCNCYNYQACEAPDYYESEAHAIITTIRERAIYNLPGYDEAPWGL